MSDLMTFEEFTEQVKKEIRNYLPPDYADAKMEVTESLKINSAYQSMTIKKEGQQIAAAVNLNEMYKEYERGGELMPVLFKIADIVLTQPDDLDVKKLENYEMAKESLFIRVCNAESNKELLASVPHETVGDLAVTYHVMMDRSEDGYGSTIVSNNLLEKYGITESQLKADAMENCGRILSPTLEPMNQVMARMMGFKDVDLQSVPFDTAVENFDFEKDNMFVLSNTAATNGASTIFYPEVMEKIGEHAGGDFFVIPSSVHEVLLVPDDGVMKRNDLEKIIREINSNEVDPKDRLSDSLYHYDNKEHKLERAVDFEQRQEIAQVKGQEKISVREKLKEAEAKAKEQKLVSKPSKEQSLG